jgi:hypothetical protein
MKQPGAEGWRRTLTHHTEKREPLFQNRITSCCKAAAIPKITGQKT